MSAREKFDAGALTEVLGGRAPRALARADRVALIAEVARALLDGREPDRAAALFVGGGIASWLAQGGDLARDFWRVSSRRGSHDTPSRIYLRAGLHRDEGQADMSGCTVATDISD